MKNQLQNNNPRKVEHDFFADSDRYDDMVGFSVKRKSGMGVGTVIVSMVVIVSFIFVGRLLIKHIFSNSSFKEVARSIVSSNSKLNGLISVNEDNKMENIQNIEKNETPGSTSEKFGPAETKMVDEEAMRKKEEFLKSIPVWNTDSLYSSYSDPRINQDIEELKRMTASFVAEYSVQEFSANSSVAHSLIAYGEVLEILGRLETYAHMSTAVDKTDAAKKMASIVTKVTTGAYADIKFYDLLLARLTQEQLSTLVTITPDITKFLYYINRQMEHLKHNLPTDVEKYSVEKNLTANAAWVKLFDNTIAKMKFNVDDNNKDLNISFALNLLFNKSADVRCSAGKALGETFKQNADVVAAAYNAVVRDWLTDLKARKYSSPMEPRNFSNDIDQEVVDSMLRSISSYKSSLERYYLRKAKLMGMRKLRYCDRVARLNFADSGQYSWLEAKNTVISAYKNFSPRMATIVESMFDENRIHARPNDYKDGGAFCTSASPRIKPFVEMSYLGTQRDLFTLAHELGHSVHFVLSSKDGKASPLLYFPPLTVAETASIFGEKLLFENLMKEYKERNDVLKVADLLSSKIEGVIGSVFRQAAFTEFEKRIYDKSKDADLSTEEILKIWMDVQEESLGNVFLFEENDKYYWTYVSHFVHVPFYVYAYAFAELLVSSLYELYKSGKVENFEAHFIEFLSSGGSKNYKDMLAVFNVHSLDSAFWNNGLNAFSKMVDEFERITSSEEFSQALKSSNLEIKINLPIGNTGIAK